MEYVTTTAATEADAVRSDGRLVHIRPIQADDHAGLEDLDNRVSDRSIYQRFFTMNRRAAHSYLDQLLRPSAPDHEGLVAEVEGRIIGVAAFERLEPTVAEFALLIDDANHHQGIGTLLIEHLAARARAGGVTTFRADVLNQNAAMLAVLRGLGFSIVRHSDHETSQLSIDISPGSVAQDAADERDRSAVARSLQPVLSPRSIAVVGASVRSHTVGHEVVRSIIGAGFSGDLFVVNPHQSNVLGIPSLASPSELPIAVDLAIIAVPAAAVADVVDACGERGIGGILLLSAGFGETGEAGRSLQQVVLGRVRKHGMRMVGPNCLGLVNTDPTIALNATFGPMPMQPGSLGLVSQSGALGIAVLGAAQDCGLPVAQFVSVGNKADVSSNDLLLAWQHDDRVSVIALYLESFGNPRKFARIARRVSRQKPIIAIKAGRTRAGQRAGLSHTAAAASSDSVVDALFTQAGVLRVDRMQDMLDVARVLCDQPLPRGARIAIVGNSGGPGILAADAAESAGLIVVDLDAHIEQAVLLAAPAAASVSNPIDLGAGAQPDDLAGAVRVLLGAPDVDVVLAIFTETLVADPAAAMAAVAQASAEFAKPIVATAVGKPARSIPLRDSHRSLPIFTFPEAAVAALGEVVRYAAIRSADHSPIVRPANIDSVGARAFIDERLADGSGWLDAVESARLLTYYGIPLVPQCVVHDAAAAARVAADLGYPVAIKIAAGVVHKSDIGGVRLGIDSDAALAQAFADVVAVAPDGSGVLIQPMAPSGTELIVGAVQDPQFGPVLMVGAGGVLADVIADRQLRLAPISASEAEEMITNLRSVALLDGYRGRPSVSRPAVSDLLVRVSLLADELGEVAELDLNPVVCLGGDDLVVLDAKVRIAAAEVRSDSLLRELHR